MSNEDAVQGVDGLVERLALRWERARPKNSEESARWWLLRIAEEVRAAPELRFMGRGQVTAGYLNRMAKPRRAPQLPSEVPND